MKYFYKIFKSDKNFKKCILSNRAHQKNYNKEILSLVNQRFFKANFLNLSSFFVPNILLWVGSKTFKIDFLICIFLKKSQANKGKISNQNKK